MPPKILAVNSHADWSRSFDNPIHRQRYYWALTTLVCLGLSIKKATKHLDHFELAVYEVFDKAVDNMLKKKSFHPAASDDFKNTKKYLSKAAVGKLKVQAKNLLKGTWIAKDKELNPLISVILIDILLETDSEIVQHIKESNLTNNIKYIYAKYKIIYNDTYAHTKARLIKADPFQKFLNSLHKKEAEKRKK